MIKVFWKTLRCWIRFNRILIKKVVVRRLQRKERLLQSNRQLLMVQRFRQGPGRWYWPTWTKRKASITPSQHCLPHSSRSTRNTGWWWKVISIGRTWMQTSKTLQTTTRSITRKTHPSRIKLSHGTTGRVALPVWSKVLIQAPASKLSKSQTIWEMNHYSHMPRLWTSPIIVGVDFSEAAKRTWVQCKDQLSRLHNVSCLKLRKFNWPDETISIWLMHSVCSMLMATARLLWRRFTMAWPKFWIRRAPRGMMSWISWESLIRIRMDNSNIPNSAMHSYQ